MNQRDIKNNETAEEKQDSENRNFREEPERPITTGQNHKQLRAKQEVDGP